MRLVQENVSVLDEEVQQQRLQEGSQGHIQAQPVHGQVTEGFQVKGTHKGIYMR